MSRERTRCLAAVVPVILQACASDVPTIPGAREYAPTARAFVAPEWSTPVNLGAAVNSSANEQNATLSRDELSLYFTSDRPGGLGGLDIWVARRDTDNAPWHAPVNLRVPINGPANDFAPNLSIDGHLLFFTSNRPGGQGNNDIYLARRAHPNDAFGWGSPVNLGPGVNTADAENAPMYLQSAEAGSANLYFNRGALALGQADIYYAAIARDGSTRGPAALVTALSVPDAIDAAPTVRKDGKEVFFYSSRPGTSGATDLWTSTRRSASKPWSDPVNPGAPLNTAFGEVTPSLSFDGRTLIFASNRPGGLGGNDIRMTTRSPYSKD